MGRTSFFTIISEFCPLFESSDKILNHYEAVKFYFDGTLTKTIGYNLLFLLIFFTGYHSHSIVPGGFDVTS